VAYDPAFEARFRQNAKTWRFLRSQPPGYRKLATGWVGGAKRAETREKPLLALIECSGKEERLPQYRR
jgi:hypothetical protein